MHLLGGQAEDSLRGRVAFRENAIGALEDESGGHARDEVRYRSSLSRSATSAFLDSVMSTNAPTEPRAWCPILLRPVASIFSREERSWMTV